MDQAHRSRIEAILAELGMGPAHPRLARLTAFAEATELAPTRCAVSGADFLLAPEASAAWTALARAAAADGIGLELISGFRSYAYQRDLIRRRMADGRSLEDVLQSVAPPGFSEHHTGEAADIGSPGDAELTEAFAGSPEFRWLAANAARFGWTMSYPPGNEFGFVYEPWHWKWHSSSPTP